MENKNLVRFLLTFFLGWIGKNRNRTRKNPEEWIYNLYIGGFYGTELLAEK